MFIVTVAELPPVFFTIKFIVTVSPTAAVVALHVLLLASIKAAVLTTSEAFWKVSLTLVPEAVTLKV